MRSLSRHPVLIFFLATVLALGYVVYSKVSQEPQAQGGFAGGFGGRGDAVPVEVEMVARRTVADRVESVGTTVANESINITSKVSETISKVHFEDGAFVKEGDVLLELTNDDEASRLAEAQASASDARRQFERLQELVANKLVSNTELDQAQTAMKTADARLEGVLVAMDDRLVRAPFSGVLGFRNVSAGTLLSPTTVITTLDDISLIKLDFTIPEIYLAEVQAGQTLRALSIVYPDREFSGIISVIGSRIDPVTRSVQVRAHIDNPDAILRPGMLLTVALDLNSHEATVIPEQAVVSSQDRHYVFVLEEGDVAQRVEVTLGRRQPGFVEILSGLIPGQRVISQGASLVRPGQTVNVVGSSGLSMPRASMPGNTSGSAY